MMYPCGVPKRFCTLGTGEHPVTPVGDVALPIESTACRTNYLENIEGKVIPFVDDRDTPVIVMEKSALVLSGRLEFSNELPLPGSGLDDWIVNHVTGIVDDDPDDDCWIEPEFSDSPSLFHVLEAKKEEWSFSITWDKDHVNVVVREYTDLEVIADINVPYATYATLGRQRNMVETAAHGVCAAAYWAIMNSVEMSK